MSALILGAVGFGSLLSIVVFVCVKGEIDTRHIVKKANEYEEQRLEEGKSVEEWYGKE